MNKITKRSDLNIIGHPCKLWEYEDGVYEVQIFSKDEDRLLRDVSSLNLPSQISVLSQTIFACEVFISDLIKRTTK